MKKSPTTTEFVLASYIIKYYNSDDADQELIYSLRMKGKGKKQVSPGDFIGIISRN